MEGKLSKYMLVVFGILLGSLLVMAVQSFNGTNKETKRRLHDFDIIFANPDSNVVFITYPTPVARINPRDSERFLGFDVYTHGKCVANVLLSYEENKNGTLLKGATASVTSPCL